MKKVIFTLALLFTVLCSLFTAKATNVSGGIYSNTTWTLLNSPYIVTDNVVVFPGNTLTIEAGVIVKFADTKSIEIRQASLIAIGTILDSITFTSNNASPTPGIWDKVWLNGGSMTTEFIFCSFKFATKGICEGNGTTIIKKSNFDYNRFGILGGYTTYIDTCSFTNNTEAGIGGGATIVNYCTFKHNHRGTGDDADGPLGVVEIRNCLIDSNQIGMIIGGRVRNCVVKHNQTGITGNSVIETTILNSIIDSNSIVGIKEWGSYSNDSIFNNQIMYNGLGLDVLNTSQFLISRNVIEYNNIGVLLDYGIGNIYCNKISNNISFDLKSSRPNPFNVSLNDWGTTDSTTIALHIWDGYDTIAFGLGTFMPIDTLQCYLTGCNLQLSTSVVNATCNTCANGTASVSMSNGFAPYTYTWNTSPIQTTQMATGLLPGTYTVCVVDANGCTACHAVYVDSTNCTSFHDSLLSVSNATCALCSDGSATINIVGGTTPYQYTWYTSPMQSTATATGLPHGSYQICVFDAAGCHLCDTAIIGTGNCSAHFNLYPDTNILHNYFAVNMASGVTPISYDWNWGDNSPHDFTPFPSHQYANAGYYNICLSITDAVGCTSTYCNNFYLLRTSNTMVYVNVVSTLTTGIYNLAALNITSIFPNPATSSITVHQTAFKANQNFIITDVLGNKVYAQTLNNDEETMDISHLNSGIYFYEINGNRGKIIKE